MSITKSKQLKVANELWRKALTDQARAAFLRLCKDYPEDQDVMICAVDFFQALGDNIGALEVLGEYLSHNEADALTLEVCVFLAIKIKAYDFAEKLAICLVQLQPDEAKNYVNLINALQLQDKFEEAIEIAMAALERFPEHGKLWQVTAECFIKLKGSDCNSYELMRQALVLDPENCEIMLSLANQTSDFYEADKLYRKALSVEPDKPEIHLSYAITLLGHGRLAEAWPHYEYRLNPQLGSTKSQKFTCTAPVWRGEPLEGKSILIGAEQGIGDEILFSRTFHELLARGARLLIGCDPRLIGVFERSFKGAVCGAFEDRIYGGIRYRSFPTLENEDVDYFIAAGSLPQFFWGRLEDLSGYSEGGLLPDKDRVADMKSLLPQTEKPLIGLSWRSGNMTEGRAHGYIGIEAAKLLVSRVDANFVNLQYSAQEAELDELKQVAKNEFLSLKDIDLKQDIEANLAIMSVLDYVVGSATSTQMMAASIGVPTGIISFGLPWWGFGEVNSNRPRLASNVEWFLRTSAVRWDTVMLRVAQRLHEQLGVHVDEPTLNVSEDIGQLVRINTDKLPLFPSLEVGEYEKSVRKVVIGKLQEFEVIGRTNSNRITISNLRKFGARLLLTGIGRNCLSEELNDKAIPFDQRRNIGRILKIACDPEVGGITAYQKAILMTFVYTAFGYNSFCVAIGRIESAFNHVVNIVQNAEGTWTLQDSFLDCYLLNEQGDQVDFFEMLRILSESDKTSNNLFDAVYEKPEKHVLPQDERIEMYRDFYVNDCKEAIVNDSERFNIPNRWESAFLFPQDIFGHPNAKEFAITYVETIMKNNKKRGLIEAWSYNSLE